MQQIFIGVAQINCYQGPVRHHVDQIGLQVDGTACGHLIAAHIPGKGSCLDGDAGGDDTGIMAHVHGGGTGVIGDTAYDELGPGYTLHTFDNADSGPFGIEHRTLLDMQLKITMGAE